MSKKDFELIALILRENAQHAQRCQRFIGEVAGYHANISETMADALANVNPRFDRERFLTACQPL